MKTTTIIAALTPIRPFALSWLAVSMAAMSAFAGTYCGVEELPDLIKCLPAPPKPGSADFARDVARYEWGKEQRKDPERAAMAKHDAVWSFGTVAESFSRPFGMEISPTNTPKIWKVLEDSLSTTDQMRVAPKAFFHRRRPFAYFNEEPLCPKEDGVWRDEGSYPSGHTMRSMVAALVLAEINPARADEIFVRAMQYGENRVIAGAHWQSDVDMTRLAAAIGYSRLQTIPSFRAQMDVAKGEFAALAAGLLLVIPQPTQWTPAGGECDLATASVSVAVCTDSGLGEEGYTMKIAPGGIKIVAGGETGRVWAWQTIAQLKAAGAKAPCGCIRDVPKYRLRGFVMDVARMYHSMDFLRDLAKTMSYYKMNTLHVHLNDNEIAPKNKPDVDWSKMYAAFRMECETYPELTAKDGHYTKKEFREFVLFCKSIGVTVVPEFDVPAHSLAFTRVKPEFASAEYGADHFDLSKSDQILAWLKPLFAEYMTGAEPVFAGPYMHVGTDEYNKKEAEKFRAFTDSMLKMVEGFGYRPCAWGALTHASGKTPVMAGRDVTMDIWYNPYYQPAEALDAGYTIVSVPDGLVYIVPYAGYYYDYLNCKHLYESWEPRNVGNYTVPDGYMDKLAGGKFALWNDCLGKKKSGERYSESDNWDRIYPALQTLSQKMWTGKRTDQAWEKFAALADAKREPNGVKSSHKTTLSNVPAGASH